MNVSVIAAALSTQLNLVWNGMLQRPSLFLLCMGILLFASSWVVQALGRSVQTQSAPKRAAMSLIKGELS